jgi:hypothetical protein
LVAEIGVLYSVGAAGAKVLEGWKLYRLVDPAKRLAVERMLLRGDSLPPLDGPMRERLTDLYRDSPFPSPSGVVGSRKLSIHSPSSSIA